MTTAIEMAHAAIAAQRITNAEFDAAAAAAAAKQQERLRNVTDFATKVLERSSVIGPKTKQVYVPFAHLLAALVDKKLNWTADIAGFYDIVLSFMHDLNSEPAFIAAHPDGHRFAQLYLDKLQEMLSFNRNPSNKQWTDFGAFTDDQLLALQHAVLTFGELFFIKPELFLPEHLD